MLVPGSPVLSSFRRVAAVRRAIVRSRTRMAPLTHRTWQISIDRVRETRCTIGQFDNGNAIWA
jgi:hypothetical protein